MKSSIIFHLRPASMFAVRLLLLEKHCLLHISSEIHPKMQLHCPWKVLPSLPNNHSEVVQFAKSSWPNKRCDCDNGSSGGFSGDEEVKWIFSFTLPWETFSESQTHFGLKHRAKISPSPAPPPNVGSAAESCNGQQQDRERKRKR